MKRFCDRLRDARKASGHTQESIAEAIGMLRTNYVPFETGRKLPDVSTRTKLAKALSIDETTLKAWAMLESASFEEKVIMLKELLTEGELKAMIDEQTQKRKNKNNE